MSIAEETIEAGNGGHCPVSGVGGCEASESNGLEV